MKLDRLNKRLDALEPDPIDTSGLEQDIALFKAFVPCYMEHLQKLGVPADIQEEMKETLETTGPRPFGHDCPDDRPFWMPLDEVASHHWQKCGWKIKAAQFFAWADVYADLGLSEEATEYRKIAEEHLAHEAQP